MVPPARTKLWKLSHGSLQTTQGKVLEKCCLSIHSNFLLVQFYKKMVLLVQPWRVICYGCPLTADTGVSFLLFCDSTSPTSNLAGLGKLESCCCQNEKKHKCIVNRSTFLEDHKWDALALADKKKEWLLHRKRCSHTVKESEKVQPWACQFWALPC